MKGTHLMCKRIRQRASHPNSPDTVMPYQDGGSSYGPQFWYLHSFRCGLRDHPLRVLLFKYFVLLHIIILKGILKTIPVSVLFTDIHQVFVYCTFPDIDTAYMVCIIFMTTADTLKSLPVTVCTV